MRRPDELNRPDDLDVQAAMVVVEKKSRIDFEDGARGNADVGTACAGRSVTAERRYEFRLRVHFTNGRAT